MISLCQFSSLTNNFTGGLLLMNTSETESAVHIFMRVVNRYISTENRPCDYGVGCILYRSAIHTIEAIGNHKQINVTDLSNYLGVTKSAVSQMTDKLIKKDMIVKTVLSKSDTEVALTLTDKGDKVFIAHNEYHRKFFQHIEQLLSTVSEEDIKAFENIMNQFETFLEEEK